MSTFQEDVIDGIIHTLNSKGLLCAKWYLLECEQKENIKDDLFECVKHNMDINGYGLIEE